MSPCAALAFGQNAFLRLISRSTDTSSQDLWKPNTVSSIAQLRFFVHHVISHIIIIYSGFSLIRSHM